MVSISASGILPFNMLDPEFFYSAPESEVVPPLTPTSIVGLTPSGRLHMYLGDFQYEADPFTGEVFLTGGTMTQFVDYIHDGRMFQPIYYVSDIAVTVYELVYFESLEDPGALREYVFRFGDNVTGSGMSDNLLGFGGDDVITPGGGNDYVDGGNGFDEVRYLGPAENYIITQSGIYTYVTDRTGVDGTDTLVNVEQIRLSQGASQVVKRVNLPPVVDASNYEPRRGMVVVRPSVLVSARDPEGGTIVAYQLWDPTAGGGHFTADDVKQGDNTVIHVTPQEFGRVSYVLGSTTDTLWVRASDGTNWSEWTSFTVAPARNHAPAVTGFSLAPGRGTASMAAESLMQATDHDGDMITAFQFWDESAGGGHFTVNGVKQGDNTVINVPAADLATVRYQYSSTTDQVWVRASDGAAWSEWTALTVVPPENHAPGVVGINRQAGINTPLAVTGLFTAGDRDGDSITKYQFWDSAPGGGRFEVAGAAQADNTAVEVMADQLAAASFVTGGSAGSDLIWARAFDGWAWGEWKSSTVTTLAQS